MEHDLIKLRFKYFNFDQLSEKNDFIRIHQLYEQLKYTILSDEFAVTEDQALTLASLQYYIDDCHKRKIVDDSFHIQEPERDAHNSSFDIDNMLDNLEIELEGKDRTKDQPDLPTIPELSDLVRIYHPHRLLSSLGKFQDKKWMIYKDTTLSAFKSREDAATNATGSSVSRVEIKRAELSTETSVKNGVFIVKVKPHDSEELWLKFERESQFCRWYAALKLGCKGTTMASNNYKNEIDKLKQVIKIQDIDDKSIDHPDQLATVRTKFYVSKKHLKKLGHAKIAAHILSHQAKIGDSVRQQPTLAKMTYIHVWEHIEHAGRAYFQVNFKKDSKKEDFVALSAEKIMRLDQNGKIIQSWWLQTLREWKINWAAEPKRVELFLNKDTEEHEKIEFFISHRSNPIKDLQVIHEYIGGYMFHHMTKQIEPDDAEEVKLRSLLDVTDPWHNNQK
jgi:kindlin 2